jgi:two-component system, chemotaxis family, CheB/CheR fusion protein
MSEMEALAAGTAADVVPAATGPMVVGIGASAGGLAALRTLFGAVQPDNGLAWVVVVHLSPEHESHLADLLQPHVCMPVQQITQTTEIEADHVYVIPPAANLNTIDTHLRLSDLGAKSGERAPVDRFLRTLAATHSGHAAAVILTGSGSDGALGIRAIKEKAGLTLVQDPEEAEYDGMPRSAVGTGLVDLVLPLAEIPAALLRFARTRPQLVVTPDDGDVTGDHRRLLLKVFAQIRARTGRDFTRYKRSTVLRRIQRRMQLRQIEELEAYLAHLREDGEEVLALADDLLITVTTFFRDPEVWDRLAADVVPALFEELGEADSVRVWSVGCATGEEAYSLAMLLLEEAGRRETVPQVQVFASDLHEPSLARAREGFYPGDITVAVPPDRLARFFQQEDGGFRVRKEVRELVIFAPHNLLTDPPYAHVDLISCRNLLIYLQRDVQRDVIDTFNYALNPDGVLVLGTSESLEDTGLFRTGNKRHCFYRKRNVRGSDPRLSAFPPMRPRQLAEPRRVGFRADEHARAPGEPEAEAGGAEGGRALELESELEQSRRRMQAIIEEYETSQEEMRASHEELQSSNEELRSTLEELETSKEELQSMNEELQTVNRENRHRVEELAQLTGDLQNLLTATDIATLFLDPELRILRFTPSVGEIFNVRAVDRGRPLSDLTHRLAYGELHQDAERVLHDALPIEREVSDDAGRWYLVRVLPYRTSRNLLEGVVVTFIDITGRHEAEEALRASHRDLARSVQATSESQAEQRRLVDSVKTERGRLEAVLASLPLGVWIADRDGRLVGRNEQADRIWLGDGPAVENIDDYPAYSAFASDGSRLDAADHPVAVALRTGDPIPSRELRIRRFDGSDGTILVSAAPIRNPDGAVIGAVGVSLDITHRKQDEELLRVAKETAERASEVKSQFMSTMSHELRTPLNAVIGLSDLLAREVVGFTNERQREYLARIQGSAWHLVTIIDEILTFTRAEAGREEVHRAAVDVAGIARSVVEMMRLEAEARGLGLSLAGAGEPLMVDSDAGKIRQILVNVVGNAVKFTTHGGVSVELESTPHALIFSVRDSGPGIPGERLEDIFEPFVQVDGSATRQHGGTGLGLAIARRLARLLGGEIRVTSARGQGSTFTISLPRSGVPTDDTERVSGSES